MATIYEMREEALRISNAAKAKLNEITATTDSTRSSEIEAEFDRMVADADILEARAAKLEKLESREAILNAADPRRPSEDRSVETSKGTAEQRQAIAFNSYLRGDELTREQRSELRADQSVGTNNKGGFLVPTTFVNDLILSLKSYGPMLDDSLVNYIRTASGNPINMPSLDDTANKATILAENACASQTDLTFAQKTLGAYKYTTGFIKVSNELLQDSAIDVQAVISAAMAERMGRAFNEHLTTGNGTTQPHGVVTAVGSAGGVDAAAAGGVAADDLLNLIHDLDPAYRSNASFMLADGSLKALRKLKDTQGQYIWSPGMTVSETGTLFGHRYYINQDMAAIGASAIPILFGDFKRYTVRMVREFALKRLDERFGECDQVAFVGFARIDGELMDNRAIRGLENPAS